MEPDIKGCLLANFPSKHIIYPHLMEIIEALTNIKQDIDKRVTDESVEMISANTIQSFMENFQVNNVTDLAKKIKKNIDMNKSAIGLNFPSEMKVEFLMQKTINDFNNSIPDLKTKDPDEKLKHIFYFIQRFLLIHPFTDANNRVFVNELANRLLLQNGFDFTVYFDPFIFYGHSLDEVVAIVKLAIGNYLSLHDKDHDFEIHLNIENLDDPQLFRMVAPLRNFLSISHLERGTLTAFIEDSFKNFIKQKSSKVSNFFKSKTLDKQLKNDLTEIKAMSFVNDVSVYLHKKMNFYSKNKEFQALSRVYYDLIFNIKVNPNLVVPALSNSPVPQ